MTKQRARPSPARRAAAPATVALATVALVLATAGTVLPRGSLVAQEVEFVVPAEGSGPALDLWIERSYPDLEFGYSVSEEAYVAAFEVVPGLGATLVLPDRERARPGVDIGRLTARGAHYGILYRDDASFRRALGGRHLSVRYGYGMHRPERGYLVLVASRTPLELWRFGRLDDYRYAAGGVGAYTPYDGDARRSVERLVRRVVTHPARGGWSTAYVSYSLLPHVDRFAAGYGASLCYGFGYPGLGFGGFGFLPIGSYRYGGYGYGLPSSYFPGFRGFHRHRLTYGTILWSDPFGFGPGFGYGTGLGSPCAFGFATYPFGFRFRGLFPRHPDSRRPPPVGGGRQTAAMPPEQIHPQPEIPKVERLGIAEESAPSTGALPRGPVPVPGFPGRLERLTPAGGAGDARGRSDAGDRGDGDGPGDSRKPAAGPERAPPPTVTPVPVEGRVAPERLRAVPERRRASPSGHPSATRPTPPNADGPRRSGGLTTPRNVGTPAGFRKPDEPGSRSSGLRAPGGMRTPSPIRVSPTARTPSPIRVSPAARIPGRSGLGGRATGSAPRVLRSAPPPVRARTLPLPTKTSRPAAPAKKPSKG